MTMIDHLPFKPGLLLRLAPVALLATACTPVGAAEDPPATQNAQEDSAKHPISGLEIIDVAIVSGETRHVFKTELAASAEAQTRGLMFRTELADDEAMLFPSYVPQTRSFWMRNTPISLDIIFVGTDGKISNIAERTEPYSLESLPSEGLASAVFEVRGGLTEELGIEPGDAVEYQLPEIPAE
ncbi:DUF192 domain-containing protein [Erythrobacter sp. F6033]|uniref:DUF192 domain-containing protein n=1 Tax=Erythrobacter sp. F6033 TaxID=2926401 RepID=UPI001FF6401C|nr:DUF192 domain-containing protein [Erythrobacter sp. F6033]MCK0129346.1 DUF192 domain-containing protein [Erythrobacter sp. F6033]